MNSCNITSLTRIYAKDFLLILKMAFKLNVLLFLKTKAYEFQIQ